MKCRSCKCGISPFLSLGKMPAVNFFLKKEQLNKEKRYELALAFCQNCYLVQLTKTINPKLLFEEYVYFSSTSTSFLEHSRKTALSLYKRLKLNKFSLVLEIASNDGAQLQYFKELGVRILGVDPAKNIAKIANSNGIETIPAFFNHKFAKDLVRSRRMQADLIYGANVLAHVPNIVDFVKGIKVSLKSQGTVVFEFPYLKGLLENKFDIIYHEHVFYYSLIALQNLFKRADLEIYDVEITTMQGGSLLIFISHPNVFRISDNVRKLRMKEIKGGYDNIETYKKTSKDIMVLKKNLIQILSSIKSRNKTIAAYGAPAKGVILLNFFEIGKKYLSFLVDKSKVKQGLYMPGIHMKVKSPSQIYRRNPDYVLILPWNIADEIISQLDAYKKRGGKFIIPVPSARII